MPLTEEEYLESAEPLRMIGRLYGDLDAVVRLKERGRRGSAGRKLRLAGAAMCRVALPDVDYPIFRRAILVAEAYADRAASSAELAIVRRDLYKIKLAGKKSLPTPWHYAVCRLASLPMSMSRFYATTCQMVNQLYEARGHELVKFTGPSPQCLVLADLFRDVVGNIFKPDKLPASDCVACGLPLAGRNCASCRSRNASPLLADPVLALAKMAYAERDEETGHLDRASLNVIADLFEERGCRQDDPVMLHLRGPGPHVRGCWALDLVLGNTL